MASFWFATNRGAGCAEAATDERELKYRLTPMRNRNTISHMKDTKDIISVRIRPETLARIQVLIQGQGNQVGYRGAATVKPTVSSCISDLLDAVTERRLMVLAEPAPYYVNDGSDPNQPLLVAECQYAT